MKIVSFIKESFLEYEDYVSLVLFSYGCNMKCGYCYNYHHITNPDLVMADNVYSIIDNQITDMTDGLVFLGGEPTIYGHELFDVSSYSKRKYGVSVKLFSNGTNPDLIMEGMTNRLFDHVSVDFKSYHPTDHILIKGKWSNYIGGLMSLIATVEQQKLHDRFEVRMTVSDGMEDSFESIKRICNDSGVRLHRQVDVRDSYREIGVSPLSCGHALS